MTEKSLPVSDTDFKPIGDTTFTSKERDILEKNKRFYYADKKYIDTLLEIINGESNISIRLLDWFVVYFSKKRNTIYRIKSHESESIFNVNIEYKNQLNGYSKQYFDPFCRKKKVMFKYAGYYKNKSNTVIKFVTSIGQLNFFQWAIRNKVIHYVNLHFDEIEADMKETYKLNKELKLSEKETEDDNEPASPVINDIMSDEPDPVICSTDSISVIRISSSSNKSDNKTTSSTKQRRRRQLSKALQDTGIKKSSITIRLDFD